MRRTKITKARKRFNKIVSAIRVMLTKKGVDTKVLQPASTQFNKVEGTHKSDATIFNHYIDAKVNAWLYFRKSQLPFAIHKKNNKNYMIVTKGAVTHGRFVYGAMEL